MLGPLNNAEVLPVREADGGEAPEDARQFHAYTVERLEGHPAVPVSIHTAVYHPIQ